MEADAKDVHNSKLIQDEEDKDDNPKLENKDDIEKIQETNIVKEARKIN